MLRDASPSALARGLSIDRPTLFGQRLLRTSPTEMISGAHQRGHTMQPGACSAPRRGSKLRGCGLERLDRHLTPLDYPVAMLQRERPFSEQAVVKFHSLLPVEDYGD
jgi:hypothetical protein